MITDVLRHAIEGINSNLNTYGHVYRGDLRKRIVALRTEIEAVHAWIDREEEGALLAGSEDRIFPNKD